MKSESLLARVVLAAAIIGGVSYLAADYLPLTVAVGLAWKGSGVALLALYAALRARSLDGWLLAAVMAFGAAGAGTWAAAAPAMRRRPAVVEMSWVTFMALFRIELKLRSGNLR